METFDRRSDDFGDSDVTFRERFGVVIVAVLAVATFGAVIWTSVAPVFAQLAARLG